MKNFEQYDIKPSPAMQQRIGLYPIVDSAKWVEKLLVLGVVSIQLRMKNQPGHVIEQHVIQSIALAKQYNAQLFVNDYWQLAIEHEAFGVHLGQGDIINADMLAIKRAELRLGISTHSDLEIERALSYQPSYIAFGPIYHTETKQMPYAPQGLGALRRCCEKFNCPVVAIGGINHNRVEGIVRAGADGAAVLSAIVNSNDPKNSVNKFLGNYPAPL